MTIFQQQVEAAVAYIKSRLLVRPEMALILGTGLGRVAEAMEGIQAFPYEDIPHFPVSTVPSHAGRLLSGYWAGRPILAMQGRFHLYEGYTAAQISFPIRVLRGLGVNTIITSNAAGGLNFQFAAGDLMLITDHINLTGHNPLVGQNVDEWGPRFPEMTEPYDRRLQMLAVQAALTEKILLHKGVYIGVLGPSLETAAETRFLRAIGADAVGMSTITEVITAVHSGIKVLGISVITNVNLPDAYQPANIEEVIATAELAGPNLMLLIEKVVGQL
jgi:purine-nucleoside phosphorylase